MAEKTLKTGKKKRTPGKFQKRKKLLQRIAAIQGLIRNALEIAKEQGSCVLQLDTRKYCISKEYQKDKEWFNIFKIDGKCGYVFGHFGGKNGQFNLTISYPNTIRYKDFQRVGYNMIQETLHYATLLEEKLPWLDPVEEYKKIRNLSTKN